LAAANENIGTSRRVLLETSLGDVSCSKTSRRLLLETSQRHVLETSQRLVLETSQRLVFEARRRLVSETSRRRDLRAVHGWGIHFLGTSHVGAFRDLSRVDCRGFLRFDPSHVVQTSFGDCGVMFGDSGARNQFSWPKQRSRASRPVPRRISRISETQSETCRPDFHWKV
jgi:hypothetical protein